MKVKRLGLLFAVAGVVLGATQRGEAQVNIIGSLSNFDVVNNTGRRVNDFKITIFGIRPRAIAGTYTNPKYGPPTIVGMPGNTMVKYGPRGTAFTNPGQTEHFGVTLRGNPLGRTPLVNFTWTLNNQPVEAGIDPNLPQQIWDPTRRRVIDIIVNRTWRQPRQLWVQRRVNRLPRPIELDELMRNNPIFEQARPIDERPVPLGPDQTLTFDDPFFDVQAVAPNVEGVAMMYDVFEDDPTGQGPGQRIGTVLNAANVQLPARPVIIGQSLSNFDVFNNTGITVNDFNITLFGISPNQVAGTYNNPLYGAPTVTAAGNNTIVKYGPTGNASTAPGQVAHFGVTLNGNPFGNDPRYRFTWTLNGREVGQGGDPNMPVQVWNAPTFRPIDIIINRTWRDPRTLWVRRRVNRTDRPIRLEELLPRNPIFEQARPVDPAPRPLRPDETLTFDDSFFDIFAELPAVQGVAMMYEVFEDRDGQPGAPVGVVLNAANASLRPIRTVRGFIRLQEAPPNQPLTFEFRPTDGSQPFDYTVTPGVEGDYAINNVPAGDYRLWVKGDLWLAESALLDLTQGDADNVNFSLAGGDANNDNFVDALDLAQLITAFNSTPDDPIWDPDADFNSDDSVDALDLAILITNFNTEGSP